MSWFIKSLIRTESVCWSEFWVLEATGPQLLWLYYQKMERKEKKKRWRLFVMTTELWRYRGDVTSLEQDGVWTNWTYWYRHWLWVSSDPAETGTTGTTGALNTSMMSKQWWGWLCTDGLREAMWNVISGVEDQGSRDLSSLVQRSHFVQSTVNKQCGRD